MLSNVQWEKFACKVAAGAPIGEAYIAAGYKAKGNSAEASGCRLMKRPEIQARIAELQQQAVKITLETVEGITRELNEALAMARLQERPDRMVMAAVAKAKLNGLLVERSESTVTHKHEDRVRAREAAIARRKRELAERGDDASGAAFH